MSRMLETAVAVLPLIVIAILLVNMGQRLLTRPPNEPLSPKRTATLILAGLVLALLGAALSLQRMRAPDWTLLPAVVATVAAGWALRHYIAVFRRHCRNCGVPLSLVEILFREQAADGPDRSERCPACGRF